VFFQQELVIESEGVISANLVEFGRFQQELITVTTVTDGTLKTVPATPADLKCFDCSSSI